MSWTSVSTATRYELQERLGTGGWSTIHDASGTSKAVSGKTTGSWGYRVRACNAGGCGGYSVIGTTAVTRPPTSAPTLTVPTSNTSGSYTVSWTSVSPVTRYELEERLGSGSWSKIHDASGTSKAVSGKATGSWGYRVRGCNAAGCGSWSAVKTVSVLRPPSVPQITYAHNHTVYAGPIITPSCTVTWTAVATANRYELKAAEGVALLYAGANTTWGGNNCGPNYIVRACNSTGCSAWSSPPFVPTITEDHFPGPGPGDPPLVTGEGEGE